VPEEPFPPSLRLTGRFVELVPLEVSQGHEFARGLRDPATLQFFRSAPPRSEEEIIAWIRKLVDDGKTSVSRSFATVLRSSGRPIGMTRFLRIDRSSRGVEIGGTWIDPAYWRTPVNSDAKWLILQYAFDQARMHRVQFQTDLRNVRSQRAIEGLGATPEARLREDVLLPDGSFRTSVYFSILEDEWPAVRTRLAARLARPWVPPLDASAGTERLPLTQDSSGPLAEVLSPIRFRPPVTLEGNHVRLIPLQRSQLPELTRAGAAPEIWTLLRIRHGDTPEGMAGLVGDLLALQDAGQVLPFSVQLVRGNRICGIARYLDIDRENRWVEVGTWLDPSVWRSPVNTELKYLLLCPGFDTEGVHRVQLKIDDRNVRSQVAIERLGAVYEGDRRDHYRFPDGQYRTSKYYSILASEWPRVRQKLEEYLRRPWSSAIRTLL